MSVKNVEKFFDLIRSDENIAKELIKINNKIQQKDRVFDEEQFIKSKVIPIAKKHGINFTAKEFLEYAENQISELSNEELLNISGGASRQSVAWGFLLATLGSFLNVAAINSYPLVTPIVRESDQEENNNSHKKSGSKLQENNADSKYETSNKKHNKQKNIRKSTTNTNRLGKEKSKNTSKETDRVNTFALQNRGIANFVEDEIRNEEEDKTANTTNESIGQNLDVQPTNLDEEQQMQPEEQPNQDGEPTNRDEQQPDQPEEQLSQGNNANSQDQDEDTKTQDHDGDLNPQNQDEAANPSSQEDNDVSSLPASEQPNQDGDPTNQDGEQPNQDERPQDQPEEQLSQGNNANSQNQAEATNPSSQEDNDVSSLPPSEQPNQDGDPTNQDGDPTNQDGEQPNQDERPQDQPEEQLSQGNNANSQNQAEATNPSSQEDNDVSSLPPSEQPNQDGDPTNQDGDPTNQDGEQLNQDEQIIDNYNNSSPRWRNILKYGALAAGTLAAAGYYVYTGELPLFVKSGIALLSTSLGIGGSPNNFDINKSNQNINFANTTNAHSALSPIYYSHLNQLPQDDFGYTNPPSIQQQGNTTITPSWRVAAENLPSYNRVTPLPQDLIFTPGEWHNPSQDDLDSSKLENLDSIVTEGGSSWSGEHFIRQVPVDVNEIQLQENASQIQTPVVVADSAATQFVGQQGSNIPTSVDVNKTPLNYEGSGSNALVDEGQAVVNNPLRPDLADTVDQRTVGILKKVEDRNSEEPSLKPTSYDISNSSGVNIPGDKVITTTPKGSNIPRGTRPVINIESSNVPDAAEMQLQNGTNIEIAPNTFNFPDNVSGTIQAGAPQTNTSNTSSTEVKFSNSETNSAGFGKDNADITTFSAVEDKSTNKEASSWSPLAIAGTIAGGVASLAAGLYNWLRPANQQTDQQYSGYFTAFDKGYNIFIEASEKTDIDKASKKTQQKLKENLIRSFLESNDKNANAKDLQTVIVSSDGSPKNRDAAIKNAAENSKLINRATTCVDVPIIVSQKNKDRKVESATMNVYVDNYVCTMSWDATQSDNVTFLKPDGCPNISTQNFKAAKQLLLKNTRDLNAQTASPQEKLNQLIANLRSHTLENLPPEVQRELSTFSLSAQIDYNADQMVFSFGSNARLDGTTITKDCTKTNKTFTDAQVFQKFVKEKCPFEFRSREKQADEPVYEYNDVMNKAAILSMLFGGRKENTDLLNRIQAIRQSDEFKRYKAWLQTEINKFLPAAQPIIFVTQAPAEQPAKNTQPPVELQDKNDQQNENAKEQTVNTGQLPVTQENQQSAQTPKNNDQQLNALEKKTQKDTLAAQKLADKKKRHKQNQKQKGNGSGRSRQRNKTDRLTSSNEEPQNTSITSDENQVENSQNKMQVTSEAPVELHPENIGLAANNNAQTDENIMLQPQAPAVQQNETEQQNNQNVTEEENENGLTSVEQSKDGGTKEEAQNETNSAEEPKSENNAFPNQNMSGGSENSIYKEFDISSNEEYEEDAEEGDNLGSLSPTDIYDYVDALIKPAIEANKDKELFKNLKNNMLTTVAHTDDKILENKRNNKNNKQIKRAKSLNNLYENRTQNEDPANENILVEGFCGDTSVNNGQNVKWVLYKDGNLEISGAGNMANYDYKGEDIAPAPWQLKYSGEIKTVNIKEGVTSIGSAAFMDCLNIESVKIPETVTSIGEDVFWNCESLKQINIPKNLKSIEKFTFFCCTKLQQINIPVNVTFIGENAFGFCSSLQQIEIPNSVTSIGDSAFENCSNLTNVKINYGTTSIGKKAFADCSSLQQIEIPNSVTSIGNSAFENCTGLHSIKLAEGLETIGRLAFCNCLSLKELVIPASVKFIDSFAFIYCSSLESITYHGLKNPAKSYIFSSMGNSKVTEIPSIYVPNKYKSDRFGEISFELSNHTFLKSRCSANPRPGFKSPLMNRPKEGAQNNSQERETPNGTFSTPKANKTEKPPVTPLVSNSGQNQQGETHQNSKDSTADIKPASNSSENQQQPVTQENLQQNETEPPADNNEQATEEETKNGNAAEQTENNEEETQNVNIVQQDQAPAAKDDNQLFKNLQSKRSKSLNNLYDSRTQNENNLADSKNDNYNLSEDNQNENQQQNETEQQNNQNVTEEENEKIFFDVDIPDISSDAVRIESESSSDISDQIRLTREFLEKLTQERNQENNKQSGKFSDVDIPDIPSDAVRIESETSSDISDQVKLTKQVAAEYMAQQGEGENHFFDSGSDFGDGKGLQPPTNFLDDNDVLADDEDENDNLNENNQNENQQQNETPAEAQTENPENQQHAQTTTFLTPNRRGTNVQPVTPLLDRTDNTQQQNAQIPQPENEHPLDQANNLTNLPDNQQTPPPAPTTALLQIHTPLNMNLNQIPDPIKMATAITPTKNNHGFWGSIKNFFSPNKNNNETPNQGTPQNAQTPPQNTPQNNNTVHLPPWDSPDGDAETNNNYEEFGSPTTPKEENPASKSNSPYKKNGDTYSGFGPFD